MRVADLQKQLEAADHFVELFPGDTEVGRFARQQRDLLVDMLHAELDTEALVRRVSAEAFADFIEAITELSRTRAAVRAMRSGDQ